MVHKSPALRAGLFIGIVSHKQCYLPGPGPCWLIKESTGIPAAGSAKWIVRELIISAALFLSTNFVEVKSTNRYSWRLLSAYRESFGWVFKYLLSLVIVTVSTFPLVIGPQEYFRLSPVLEK
jgi:hypothetical protein